jgi:ketosteroid isomerase-like protein
MVVAVDAQQLQDMEEIRRLKARYVHFGDTQDWAKWSELFVDDYVVEVAGMPRPSKDFPTEARMEGRDNIVAAFAAVLSGIPTAHHVMLPDITISGPGTAHAIWTLNDEIWFPTCHFRGWGHYHEDYVRVDGAWKISRTRVSRTHVEEDWL